MMEFRKTNCVLEGMVFVGSSCVSFSDGFSCVMENNQNRNCSENQFNIICSNGPLTGI